MNTLQIERLLKKDWKTKNIFKKVCALDQLEKPTFPSAYVINSDPSSEPGEHWVAVYFDKRGRGEYFDRYGLPPTLVGLESYMDAYSLSGGFTIAKPYKRTFPVFVVIIVSILFYFIVAAYLCMLLYLILRQI